MTGKTYTYDSSFGGVFKKFVPEVWEHRWLATLLFQDIAGGVPSNPKVAEGWIKSKLANPQENQIRAAVAELMAEKNLTEDEAVAELNTRRNVNGFRQDGDTGQLFIEGRTVKAAIKEAVSVALAAGHLEPRKWGRTNKGAIAFAAEHIQVLTEKVYLWYPGVEGSDTGLVPVTEPTEILQTFPINPITKQTGIQYTQVCKTVIAQVEITTDCDDYTEKEWAAIWLTGNLQGMGAGRSQDHGRYSVVGWDKVPQ